MSMFADDSKIQRKVTKENSCLDLQEDLTELYEWSQKWQMESNAEKKKCHVIKFGKSDMRPDWKYKHSNVNISRKVLKRNKLKQKTSFKGYKRKYNKCQYK